MWRQENELPEQIKIHDSFLDKEQENIIREQENIDNAAKMIESARKILRDSESLTLVEECLDGSVFLSELHIEMLKTIQQGKKTRLHMIQRNIDDVS